MKKQIEETLHSLIGHSLWGAGRSADLLTFQFGPHQLRTDRHGKSYEVGTYAFHVQCAWHLTNAHRILVASGDRFSDPTDASKEKLNAFAGEAYTWPKAESTLLDARLLTFFQNCEKTPILVQAIRADNFGSVTIKLSQNHSLTAFPDTSLGEECWRFFQPGQDLPHFVVTGQGIED